MRILLCDDYEHLSILLDLWFEDEHDLEHVASAREPDAALVALGCVEPDVVVLDAVLLGGSRWHPHEIRSARPGTRVVVSAAIPRRQPKSASRARTPTS